MSAYSAGPSCGPRRRRPIRPRHLVERARRRHDRARVIAAMHQILDGDDASRIGPGGRISDSVAPRASTPPSTTGSSGSSGCSVSGGSTASRSASACRRRSDRRRRIACVGVLCGCDGSSRSSEDGTAAASGDCDGADESRLPSARQTPRRRRSESTSVVIDLSASNTPTPLVAEVSNVRRAMRIERAVELLHRQQVGHVALVVLQKVRHALERQALLAQIVAQVLKALDVGFAPRPLRIGDEDDAVGAGEHQLARRVVVHLTRHRVELHAHGVAAQLGQLHRQKVEIERAIDAGRQRHQLSARVRLDGAVNVLQRRVLPPRPGP